MTRTRIGVVGVGHLGRHHVRLLAENPLAELVAIAEVNEESRTKTATEYGVPGLVDYREMLGQIDAVSVVVPTQLHLEVGSFFLENGVDVLVEKPISPTVADGEKLVALADAGDRILQVGHVERFNRALTAIKGLDVVPRYIESTRLAPFSFRSVDIGVVLDLMIHDLDLVLALVDSEVTSVEAFGGAVFTPAEDMASATFGDGLTSGHDGGEQAVVAEASAFEQGGLDSECPAGLVRRRYAHRCNSVELAGL